MCAPALASGQIVANPNRRPGFNETTFISPQQYAQTPQGMQERITELESRPAPAPTAAPLTAEQQQLISSGARLGTITQGQAAVKTASTAQRTPKRVAPIRSSLSTTYGTRQFTPSGESTGLNVPQ
jgi:hypothetical protein